ncbi:MAG: hypothetical protein CFE34_16345 [Rhodobacteraceae bacterium PARR1]|nr:MAG: hypothetical protein CFE34_16345 [Rhodobacteraceae bacterium PARR1]
MLSVYCRAFCLALGLLALPLQAGADVTLRLSMGYVDSAAGAVATAPTITVTDLLGDQPLQASVAPDAADAARQVATVTLPESLFSGPYARLRVAVADLRLPPGDSQSAEDIRFAFELVLRRDLLPEVIDLALPVVTSSRKGAMKPYMDLPQIAEELPARFFLAQQWMSLYQADPGSVAASPQSFALQRLISRAIADFAIRMADLDPGAVLILPAQELRDTLALYWDGMPDGREIHLRAYADARTILWLDLGRTEDLLSTARRGGTPAPAACAEARALLAFFDTHRPDEAEAAKVDSMFPNPGTLTGYLSGRRTDLTVSCARFSL